MLEIIDSFDYEDHTIINTTGGKFTTFWSESANDIEVSQSYGRNGRAGMRLRTGNVTAGSRASITHNFALDQETFYVGAAIRVDSANSGTTTVAGQGLTKPIFVFMDGTTPQCSLAIGPSMRILAKLGRPDNGTIIGRSDYILHENLFHYIEAMTTVSSVSGIFRVWVDGIERLTLTGTQTQSTSNAFVNGIQFGFSYGGSGGQTRHIRFDDIYVVETASATGRTYRLGDIIVDGLLPTSDFASEWTRSTGSTNFSNVDDAVPDGATTYNYTTQGGKTDVFGLGAYNFTGAGTVWGVQHNIYAQKADAGVVRVAPVYANSGTIGVEGDPHYLNMTYRYHVQVQENNPNGGAWSSIPSLRFGYRRK